MNAKKLIGIIRGAVEDVKKQNQSVVSADALLNYLSALEVDVEKMQEGDQRKFDADLALFRAQHEATLAHYEAQQTHSVEMLRSVISYGQSALKSAILINGGAAAALLAFIGNIWVKGIAPGAVGSITNAIVYFSFGVLSGAVGTAGSYLTQYCYSENFPRAGVVFHTLTVVVSIRARGAGCICRICAAFEPQPIAVTYLCGREGYQRYYPIRDLAPQRISGGRFSCLLQNARVDALPKLVPLLCSKLYSSA